MAFFLYRVDVKPGDIVSILIEKSLSIITTIIVILKVSAESG